MALWLISDATINMGHGMDDAIIIDSDILLSAFCLFENYKK